MSDDNIKKVLKAYNLGAGVLTPSLKNITGLKSLLQMKNVLHNYIKQYTLQMKSEPDLKFQADKIPPDIQSDSNFGKRVQFGHG